jgi:hypothetical protein
MRKGHKRRDLCKDCLADREAALQETGRSTRRAWRLAEKKRRDARRRKAKSEAAAEAAGEERAAKKARAKKPRKKREPSSTPSPSPSADSAQAPATYVIPGRPASSGGSRVSVALRAARASTAGSSRAPRTTRSTAGPANRSSACEALQATARRRPAPPRVLDLLGCRRRAGLPHHMGSIRKTLTTRASRLVHAARLEEGGTT